MKEAKRLAPYILMGLGMALLQIYLLVQTIRLGDEEAYVSAAGQLAFIIGATWMLWRVLTKKKDAS